MGKVLAVLVGLAICRGRRFLVLTSALAWRLLRGTTDVPVDRPVDLENGRMMFFAGGCASCHATPRQDDRTRLGGGLRCTRPSAPFTRPTSRRIRGRHRRLDAASSSSRRCATALAGRTASLSGLSLHLLPAHDRGRPARSLRLHEDPAAGRGPRPRRTTCRSRSTSAAASGCWKLAFLDGEMFPPDPAKSRRLESRRLPREGPGPLRRVPQRAQFRRRRSSTSRRYAGGPDPDGKGTVPNITPHPTGIGGWSADDLAGMLKTG